MAQVVTHPGKPLLTGASAPIKLGGGTFVQVFRGVVEIQNWSDSDSLEISLEYAPKAGAAVR